MVALKLGKFVHEVEQISGEELAEYLAFLKIQASEERKAVQQAKMKHGRK